MTKTALITAAETAKTNTRDALQNSRSADKKIKNQKNGKSITPIVRSVNSRRGSKYMEKK